MSFSSATIRARTLPKTPGGYPNLKSISFNRAHQLRTTDRPWKTERLIALSTRSQHPIGVKSPDLGFNPLQSRRSVVLSQHPIGVKSHELGFDPLQSRKTAGRATAIGARCAVAETQTMSRKSSSAVISPPGKETLPMLDDGGSGFRGHGYTPYYRGDGNGGGSGGGGGIPTSGDFPWGDYLFYIFLLLLRFLMMNVIGEGTCVYKYEDGRNKPIRRYV